MNGGSDFLEKFSSLQNEAGISSALVLDYPAEALISDISTYNYRLLTASAISRGVLEACH